MADPRLVALGESRRRQIVQLVGDYIALHGVSPTIAELAEALRIQPSAVRRHVGVLVDEGLLVQSPGKVRTLRPARKAAS